MLLPYRGGAEADLGPNRIADAANRVAAGFTRESRRNIPIIGTEPLRAYVPPRRPVMVNDPRTRPGAERCKPLVSRACPYA